MEKKGRSDHFCLRVSLPFFREISDRKVVDDFGGRIRSRNHFPDLVKVFLSPALPAFVYRARCAFCCDFCHVHHMLGV